MMRNFVAVLAVFVFVGILRAQDSTQTASSTPEAKPLSIAKSKSPGAKTLASGGITHEQADAILNELRRIRQLLETDPLPQNAALRRAPQSARLAVSSSWPVIGRDDAPVTVVEFLDYQCPYCRRFETETFSELKKQYIDTGKIRFISRDLPLPMHPHSQAAAEAARCATDQGKFWEMRSLLLEHNDRLEPDAITKYAQTAGLDLYSF